MQRFSLPLALVVACLSATDVGCRKSVLEAPLVEWESDISAGLDRGAKEKKHGVVLLFSADWEGGGHRMKRTEFADNEVRWRMRKDFTAIYVDCTDDEAPAVMEAQHSFGIVGLPTMLVLTWDGSYVEEVQRFHAPIGVSQLVGALDAATKRVRARAIGRL
jgi:thiol:disulfide interchange protein